VTLLGFLHRQQRLGAPFKPGFGLSGIPQHSTSLFLSSRSAAEGSAVRPGCRTKVSVPLVLPQNRHPACPGLPWERSALTDLSRDTELGGAESKDLGGAYPTHAARSFSTTEARSPGPLRCRSSPLHFVENHLYLGHRSHKSGGETPRVSSSSRIYMLEELRR
jgi:hypothetical protein